VRVTVPKGLTHKFAEDFLLSKKHLVLKHINKVKTIEKQQKIPKEQINEQEAAEFLTGRLAELADTFGFQYRRVTFRNQKTRWGSCSGKNNISLNYKIFLLPGHLQDYILVHELVHTKIKNHSKNFWDELNSIFPNAKECRQELRRFLLR
jgi:predicted metal-dependent hydrolase